VDADIIEVRGTAPAGAEIVQDIPLGFDRDATADDDGHWVMPVELEEGVNELVFRIGSDEDTEVSINIVYEPVTAAESERPTATPGPPTPTPGPTPTPVALTRSQQNAVRTAQDYLDFAAFSRSGLIRQLEYEQYSTADATFAVDYGGGLP
jgi:hypothetical protein